MRTLVALVLGRALAVSNVPVATLWTHRKGRGKHHLRAKEPSHFATLSASPSKFETTILAVAVVLTASACGGAAETLDPPNQQEPAGERLSANVTGDNPAPKLDQAKPVATPPDSSKSEQKPAQTPDPEPAPACDRNALNTELSNIMRETAFEEHKRFRCLCDDQGYTLVGNINSKGTRASDFCAGIKEKGLL